MAKKNQAATGAEAKIAAPSIITEIKTKYVIVASKMPMRVELQICRETTQSVSGQHRVADEKIFVKTGESYWINGTAYPVNTPPKGYPKRPDMIEDQNDGYALTKNIPTEFWAKWLEQNRDTDMVRNGMIKAQPDIDSLESDAAEHASVNSGLGPMNPEIDEKGKPVDRRSPRPLSMGVGYIKPEKAEA